MEETENAGLNAGLNAGISRNASINASINASVKLSKSQIQILELLKEYPKITTIELAKKLVRDDVTIARNIIKLKSLGVVERVGSDKTGNWKVN